MRSKLGKIFKEISSSGDSSDVPEEIRKELYCDISTFTPEKIAFHFSEWKEMHSGVKLIYFKNGKRTSSKSWQYFEKLSDMLNHWNAVLGNPIDLYEYFDLHFQRVKGDNLYPSQLVLEYSHEIVLGKGAMNPSLVTIAAPPTYEDYLDMLEHFRKIWGVSGAEVFKHFIELLNDYDTFPEWFRDEYLRNSTRKRKIKSEVKNGKVT